MTEAAPSGAPPSAGGDGRSRWGIVDMIVRFAPAAAPPNGGLMNETLPAARHRAPAPSARDDHAAGT
ncbi:hypothetical protein IU427_15835 [Nocardia beijingensis]|uniref:hypothetical protein n=1 Tax=Nocardia beijingensis TaxID=95162 RepID=UPI0018951551|nr:hypothetical protein [Nocardia beijingensis]MBF6466641.1 hypothetical protein [Nocardia beijingensis]